MGLIYYVAWEDYVNSLDSLDKEMQETEFSDAYRVVIASLEEGSIQQEDGLSANIYDGFLNQRLLDAVIRSDIEKTWITL